MTYKYYDMHVPAYNHTLYLRIKVLAATQHDARKHPSKRMSIWKQDIGWWWMVKAG